MGTLSFDLHKPIQDLSWTADKSLLIFYTINYSSGAKTFGRVISNLNEFQQFC
jgi:hypothetical protein